MPCADEAEKPESPKPVYRSQMLDWRIPEGEEVEATERGRYTLNIEETAGDGNQLVLTITPEDKKNPGLEVLIEINRGVPCLHITNDIFGDTVLHLFSGKDGVAIVPEDAAQRPERFPVSRFYPHDQSQNGQLYRNEVGGEG